VRIVQPSVPQREKWLPEKQGEIFRLHLDLSRRNAAGIEDGLAGVALVVWPEAAMPFRPLEHPEALTAIGDLLPEGGPVLLSGGLRVEPVGAPAGTPRQAFNSLLAFKASGEAAQIYDKIHLVPFGEYLPLQPVLEAIGLQQLTKMRGGFASGPNPRPLMILPGLPPIAGLICYEAIFPAAVVQGAERPGLIVNVTNDGWFGNTTGPRQHLHQARVRAVEEGLPIIRAANNGISALIDGNGRLLASLGLNARGVIDAALPPALAPPIYARWGDGLFLLNAFLFAGLALLARSRGAGGPR
jgi:apolipoprotein N-acyltransferase